MLICFIFDANFFIKLLSSNNSPRYIFTDSHSWGSTFKCGPEILRSFNEKDSHSIGRFNYCQLHD